MTNREISVIIVAIFDEVTEMKLIWHGHSCFQVEAEGYSVVFDPYSDGSVPGLAPLRLTADAVFCSHGHGDHNAADLVTLTGRGCPLRIEEISSFHDDKMGLLRGKNTIRILHGEGMRLAHLGDLGHMPSKKALLSLGGVDCLLIPVGGHFTIDAKTAKAVADAIGARVVIPMHYRLGGMGYDVIGTLDAYTGLCTDVRTYDSDTFTLGADTPAQTAVLTYGK